MSFNEDGLIQIYPFRSTSPVLVDVGAHQGFFSLPYARRGWRVVAFEPEAENRAAFERNLGGMPNVTCVPRAVSNVGGERVPFYVSQEHYGIHALRPFHPTHTPAYEVETVRLDKALASLGVSSATLLKVDIEGADFLALQGFDFNAMRPELVMIEFMDERSQRLYGYSHHDVAAFMAERGYVTFVSEWAPISEYSRRGETAAPHTWLRCAPYPLGHVPAWGNLLFVPTADTPLLAATLQRYLRRTRLRDAVKRIPGSRTLYRLLGRR